MEQPAAIEITQFLIAWGAGDKEALDKLIPLVHAELRRLAAKHMRNQPPDHTLQTTALVNEAYLRLVDCNRIRWQDRAHFFAISAQLMRRILVDFARSKRAGKRGGGEQKVTFDEALPAVAGKESEIIRLDEALEELAALNERQGRIVEMRYFGGMTEEEIAGALNISSRTVRRDWTIARAWLFHQLNRSGKENDPRKMAADK